MLYLSRLCCTGLKSVVRQPGFHKPPSCVRKRFLLFVFEFKDSKLWTNKFRCSYRHAWFAVVRNIQLDGCADEAIAVVAGASSVVCMDGEVRLSRECHSAPTLCLCVLNALVLNLSCFCKAEGYFFGPDLARILSSARVREQNFLERFNSGTVF